MTTVKSIPNATWNGSNAAAGMSEEALDRVIDDSFPASDPPSHTPTTSLGAPTGSSEEPVPPLVPMWKRNPFRIGASALAVVLLLVGSTAWRRHSRTTTPAERWRHALKEKR